jgi:hypothetical protein
MRVLCVRIINPATLQPVKKHPAIELDREYPVLSVTVVPERGASLHIPSADGTPAIWDAAMFVTVDGTIPGNWIARVSEGGIVELGPEAWLEPGFWERYFDREPDAEKVFETEKGPALE